jgi:predicted site-specific integrase-resolvase
MKLSVYAKPVSVTDTTAYQWWRAGQVETSHLPSGAIRGREAPPKATGVAQSARVSSAEQKEHVPRATAASA